MWVISAIFLVLWLISVHYYFPVLFILAMFAGMLLTAGWAMLPAKDSQ